MPNTHPALSALNALVIDMDGVLWRGEIPMPGLADFFGFLRQNRIDFTLATNNAGKTPARYVAKFARFGVSIAPDAVLTSALATADYCRRYPPGSRMYVIGQDGIRQALREAGFILADDEVRAVVVGIDFELTYAKLKQAALLINQGADFIGANPDTSFPAPEGLVPGNGAILAALGAATGRQPVIIGKPEQVMFDAALRRMAADPARTAMLGDRLETDILGGQRAGLHTILVLSGVTNAAMPARNNLRPTWVFDDIAALHRAWRGEVGGR